MSMSTSHRRLRASKSCPHSGWVTFGHRAIGLGGAIATSGSTATGYASGADIIGSRTVGKSAVAAGISKKVAGVAEAAVHWGWEPKRGTKSRAFHLRLRRAIDLPQRVAECTAAGFGAGEGDSCFGCGYQP